MKTASLKMEVVRCNLCGEFSIRAGGYFVCPSGCKATRGSPAIVTAVKVPVAGIHKAMKEAQAC